MVWLSRDLRARAGALAPAAEQFMAEHMDVCSGGADGLRALCTQMERWLEREDVDEEHERRFVEGAGALLGLLLIDHVGDAEHVARGSVHRVRLGEHGFFDPFAAVDRALDAKNVRAELARQVSVAEAEARGTGPIARVVHALVASMARARPDLRVLEQFDLNLSLRAEGRAESFDLDLRRAVDSTRDQEPKAVEAVAERLLSMLPGAPPAELDLEDLRTRLMPRIARRDAMRELGDGLYAAPFTQELVVALLVEYEGRARYLKRSEVASLAIPASELMSLSLNNLAARSHHARIVASEHGTLWVARTGDGRDSARVLLAGLYAELSERIGSRICIGIPHRDTFMACDDQSAAARAELARRTAHDAERAPHRLSARLFRLTASGLAEQAER